MTIIEQLKEFAKVEFKNLPASYDFDSLTAIEQAEVLKRNLEHVIEECNTFVDLTTKAFNSLSCETSHNVELYLLKLEGICKKYMDLMDDKMQRQNMMISKLEERISNLEGGGQ